MANCLHGLVKKAPHREYGHETIEIVESDSLLAGVPKQSRVWMSHGDRSSACQRISGAGLLRLPPDGGRAPRREAIFRPADFLRKCTTRRTVTRFCRISLKICRIKRNWTMGSFVERATRELQTGGGSASGLRRERWCGFSMLATLLHHAIGSRTTGGIC